MKVRFSILRIHPQKRVAVAARQRFEDRFLHRRQRFCLDLRFRESGEYRADRAIERKQRADAEQKQYKQSGKRATEPSASHICLAPSTSSAARSFSIAFFSMRDT